MRARIFPLLLATGFSGIGITASDVQAQQAPMIRSLGGIDAIQNQERRHQYRPSVKLVRATSSRKIPAGGEVSYEFSVRRGFVSHLEIRSGLKVIKTIHVGGASRGRGRLVFTPEDFARAGKSGKKIKFKLWAWQGQSSWQSVHGESIGYTLVH